MPRFGCMRLAYLLFALSVPAVVARPNTKVSRRGPFKQGPSESPASDNLPPKRPAPSTVELNEPELALVTSKLHDLLQALTPDHDRDFDNEDKPDRTEKDRKA